MSVLVGTRRPSEVKSARIGIVGHGRLGGALASVLRETGHDVLGPLGRDFTQVMEGVDELEAVLLCVPDAEIATAAARVAPGPLVGHCSGASGLAPLAPHQAFLLHPLMTAAGAGARFEGAGAAVDGSTPRAQRFAVTLARELGMRPVKVPEGDQTAYHAAASIASNFLVTLEHAAERLAASAGLERELLVPLVRATVENWAMLGSARALTGPVARGDQATIALQRAAVAERAEDLLPLFDALVEATRSLAEGQPA